MQIHQLAVDGSYLVTPKVFSDDRGLFLETFSQPAFREAVGHPLSVAQVNCSVSRRGTIRGLHAAALPGQARYVTCAQGAIVDILVDIRTGSPTYGRHVAVELSADNRQALYLAEGLAHGFAPLTEHATVVYLCSSTWSPEREIQIDPLDPELALPWPTGYELLLSDKDRAAPSLRELAERGLLPAYADCRARYAELADHAFTG
ncbi:dTDP-4-dehydrorhamnose 3,5-epimerase [Streptosporangium becharense]|uniref:dTDP-4-dehydrorhamnose 3,5-epimerase n=1 Tax=Streptosporangium becharense TaxID=1816182 RepID=A0A7W9ICD5_9ACTN|nr:dTDP-4-dehydrorhamnose 3,5-epimerase [Streptosporangium becharense]MBB2913056.1 dTDP-4-dehydrorhamnose 3,5-epimerase [Streptosporangium becharense]MBB5818119.1 dTDP-4-dehydrorhamnose 3,5-epimerase [Streptosporangium becharense]